MGDWVVRVMVAVVPLLLAALVTLASQPGNAAPIRLVELHGGDGQSYFINIEQITSLRSPIASDLKQFARGTHCLVVTTAGKFLAVRETCGEVARLIHLAPR